MLNRDSIKPILKKTLYELYKDRKPNISNCRAFGCKFYDLNNGNDNLGKFDLKSDKGIFLGYFSSRKSYRIYNKRTLGVEESIHVNFNENNENLPQPQSNDDENKWDTKIAC